MQSSRFATRCFSKGLVTLIPGSLIGPLLLPGAETYQPPAEAMEILNAPSTPALSLSPSPAYAMRIKTPLLSILGEADDNDGTFPIQSERMYEAVRGNGGTVRLVFQPAEAHGYRGKETIEHVNWEKLAWFDKYLKNAALVNIAALVNNKEGSQ